MTKYSVRKGHLYRDEKVLECPYSPRGGVCGNWCPQFALRLHQTVTPEVKLFCTDREIVLAGGVIE